MTVLETVAAFLTGGVAGKVLDLFLFSGRDQKSFRRDLLTRLATLEERERALRAEMDKLRAERDELRETASKLAERVRVLEKKLEEAGIPLHS
jgi:predicted  nucleic acid-binding Zn-ribbon protein